MRRASVLLHSFEDLDDHTRKEKFGMRLMHADMIPPEAFSFNWSIDGVFRSVTWIFGGF